MEHKTHWKKMTNTNYFGSWDLEAGKGYYRYFLEEEAE